MFAETLYAVGYTSLIASLMIRTVFQHSITGKKIPDNFILITFITYIVSLFLNKVTIIDHAWIIPRDILVGLIVWGLSKMFSDHWLWLLGAWGTFVYFHYFEQLQHSFDDRQQLPVATVAAPHPNSENSIDPSAELLFDLNDQHTLAEVERLLQPYQAQLRPAFSLRYADETDLDDYYVADIPITTDWQKIATLLEKSNLTDDVMPNAMMSISPIERQHTATATPPNAANDLPYNDPFANQQWALQQLHIDQLQHLINQQHIQPTQKVLLAILDTGVDAAHEDLQANFVSTEDRYNKDVVGHGTHCAGIAAAVSNNKLGIASAIPSNDFVTVTSIKVLGDEGNGSYETIIDGMTEAADKGAAVISMSLGGPDLFNKKRLFNKAIQYANERGAIVVAAAGNSNRDANKYTPAGCKNVITVAAVDEQLNKASFSNYVSNVPMGIAAPGVQIYSTIPNNQYANFSGTSMATPYVAGTVALLKAIRPDMTTAEMHRLLYDTGIETKNTAETSRFMQPEKALRLLLQQGEQ